MHAAVAPRAENTGRTALRRASLTGLSVTGGASLTFTPSNWNTEQKVTITADSSGTGAATFESTAGGHGKAAVTVTQIAASKEYDARFLELYGKITNPANGYFSPRGHPLQLGRDAHRRGPGPRPRDHVGGVQPPALAAGHVPQGHR